MNDIKEIAREDIIIKISNLQKTLSDKEIEWSKNITDLKKLEKYLESSDIERTAYELELQMADNDDYLKIEDIKFNLDDIDAVKQTCEFKISIFETKINSVVAQIKAIQKSIQFLADKLNNENFEYEINSLTNSFNDFMSEQ